MSFKRSVTRCNDFNDFPSSTGTMNKNGNEFTVIELKELLKAKGLSTAGAKSDLLNRLMGNATEDNLQSTQEDDTADNLNDTVINRDVSNLLHETTGDRK